MVIRLYWFCLLLSARFFPILVSELYIFPFKGSRYGLAELRRNPILE